MGSGMRRRVVGWWPLVGRRRWSLWRGRGFEVAGEEFHVGGGVFGGEGGGLDGFAGVGGWVCRVCGGQVEAAV